MLNIGYCEYEEEKRFRFRVYSMTAHKEGDIEKLLNDMHFVHCEEVYPVQMKPIMLQMLSFVKAKVILPYLVTFEQI